MFIMCVELHIKTQIRIYLHTYIIIYLYDQKILSTYLIFIKCAGVYTFLSLWIADGEAGQLRWDLGHLRCIARCQRSKSLQIVSQLNGA